MIGYAPNIQSKKVVALTRPLFESATRQDLVASICADITDALEKVKRGEMSRDDFNEFKNRAKRRLPIITPHATFTDGIRRNENAIASSLYMLDIDHMEGDPRTFYEQQIRGRLTELRVELAHITPSGEGLRLVCALPAGLDIAQAQAWLSAELGTPYDPSTKDLARASYLVPRDYVLFVSEGLFEEGASPQKTICSPLPGEGSGVRPSLQFKGIPYASVISRYWEKTGGEPARGERNVRLHRLASHLRAICDNSPETLLAVMPRYGLSEAEMSALCKSACKEPVKGSATMTRIVAELSAEQTAEGGAEGDPQDTSLSSLLARLSSKKLPKAIRGSLSGVPRELHFAVMAGVLPIAGALADQVEAEYCDGQRMRLGLMSIVLGAQASGKSVVKQVVDLWKRPLEAEDAEARKIEDEWKARKKARKANERCPDDPRVTIRVLPVTVSCSTLLKRLKNSRGHTLYSFGEELDTLRKTNGAGAWSSKYDIYRLGYDHGEWGQDYNSDQAESGTVRVAYNWTMLGTYGALRRCFSKDNVENGLSSRVLVAEMPDCSFAPMPHYGQRTAADEAAILEGVRRLRGACGFIDTPRLRKAMAAWVEEKRVEAMAAIDYVKDTFRKRAAVTGFRAGVICHLLSGEERETKATLQFAATIAELTLSGQLSVFGEALESQMDGGATQRTGCNTAVFDRLPELFTMGDIRQLKRGACGEGGLHTIVCRWSKAGWVEKADAGHWRKKRR